MTVYPQVVVNVKVKNKEDWQENEAIATAISEGERLLGANGRLLVRPSGTEPLLRIMAEGMDKVQLEKITAKIAEVIAEELA